MMRVLYFGLYDSKYARNWVLINGLRKNGVEVTECREEPRRFSLFRLALKYLKLRGRFDVVVVGFPGQEVMFLARLLFRQPIVFDVFTSHYGGYILDRKKWTPDSWRAKYFRFLDIWSCRLADVVLLDTNAHINFFVKEFGLPADRFRRIYIGANDDNFKPGDGERQKDGKFHVIFFGTFIPLQGLEYIVGAANLLKEESDIVFELIGKGQDKNKAVSLAEESGLKNIIFRDMMRPEDLIKEIARADAVLGIFGDTPKTSLVIPNKLYEALAMKKPVVTADTPAIRELFSADDLLLVRRADPESLAQGILKLRSEPALRVKLAENGHNKFLKFASSHKLGGELKSIIAECLKK